VDLIIYGELFSLAAFLIIALVAQALGVFDVGKLLTHPRDFFSDEPGWGIGTVLVAILLSYGLAEGSARLLHRERTEEELRARGGYSPRSVWTELLWEQRPTAQHGVSAVVELTNGFRFVGELATFSADLEPGNRELALRGPIYVHPPGGPTAQYPAGAFVLLREDQIRFVTGRYVAP
jgi:hypothetical protein